MTDVRTATFYFDVISPFAYLAHERLLREPLGPALEYRPVLFAALLAANGQKGPAEIDAKRRFTYRFCTWYGEAHGIAFKMPSHHPFNPVRYLRLIVALGATPAVVTAVFRAIFTTGGDPAEDAVWRPLCESLGRSLGVDDAASLVDAPSVKAALRASTDEAIARQVFGVPTLVVRGEPFWGVDALPMARDFLARPLLFDSDAMRGADATRVGAQRTLPPGR